ncbi:EAL domain-containing protein [Pseudomonas aeruginosa]|uniref:EAL domain-containing protein n=1 Tax=Pseudomonas aeruginosa TaxID=287 RepID=UPI0035BE51F5
MRRQELAASGLILELDEGAVAKVPDTSLETMVRLRMIGRGLSINDFGVGYSFLEHLRQMFFNEIKLDTGLVHNMMQ